MAVYHSHPSFVQETVSGVTAKHIKETAPPNDTPFSIQHDSVIYKDVNFPFLDTKMKAALLTLKSEQHLFIKFLLMSTASKHNDGRDAFLVMSSTYYDRTCLWSANIFTSVWQENFLFL